ncbi:MAG: phosphoribosylglycinamide formyltransferase [Actinomycetota bacterium]|nr:phosphoribosylglycinamide formyltransferase [Actinomycetota bacterium]
MRIGALASGTGSVLEAILEDDLPVSVVVVDRPCGAEKVAERAKVPVERVLRTRFDRGFDRGGYTREVVDALERHRVEVVVMAGYGTVLGRAMHERYPGRVLNTHPALLPSFPGWHAVAEALAAGVKVTGCTVHVATPEVDAGPILAQEAVPVLEGDTEETLHERIKQVERRLYPRTVREFCGSLDGRDGHEGT